MDLPHQLLVLVMSAGWCCAGCERAPFPPTGAAEAPSQHEAAPTGSAANTAWPLEVVDGLGRKVVVARPARRIVSLAPSNIEILFAVGAGNRVVGRTSVDTYPSESLALPSIGGMTPKGINLEAIVALRPDLVLATSGIQEPILAPIERLGLPVVALDATDFEGVAHNLRLVGRLTEHAAEADRLADQFLGRVQAVRDRVARRTGPRPRVLYLVGEDPLMTAGPKTFIGQMIATAGGINVFGDVAARYPKPSEEEVLVRDPEIILASVGAMTARLSSAETRRAKILSRPGWNQVAAIRAGRIIFLDEDRISRPGPRLVEGLETVADALEPK